MRCAFVNIKPSGLTTNPVPVYLKSIGASFFVLRILTVDFSRSILKLGMLEVPDAYSTTRTTEGLINAAKSSSLKESSFSSSRGRRDAVRILVSVAAVKIETAAKTKHIKIKKNDLFIYKVSTAPIF